MNVSGSGGARQDSLSAREAYLVRILERASASSSFSFGERWLFAVGGAAVAAGFVLIVVGWAGASRTVLVAGQIPYLISGGLLGLGLVFVGGFLYFARWMAVLTRESRQRGVEERETLAAMREGIDQLNQGLAALLRILGTASPGVPASDPGAESIPADTLTGTPLLVATATGSMLHRPDCPVVVGRQNLRPVQADGRLKPCGICQPTRTFSNHK